MPADPSNPRPLTEDQLADWVDGSLSDLQVQALVDASGRSDLSQRMAQMQRHKVLLATTLPERAPRDLHDRVLAALERDMLLGAVEAERSSATETPAPQLKLTGDGPTPAQRTNAARWMPRMAMAAGLLLVVGGVSFFVMKAISLSSRPLVKDQIAGVTRPAPTNPADVASGTQIAAAEKTEQADTLAEASPAATSVADATLATASSAAKQSANQILATEPRIDPKGVPLDRAAQLASEGRLAIRVVTEDTRGLASFEQAGAAPLNSPNRPWRVTKQVPAQIVASVLPSVLPRASGLDDPRVLAADMVVPMAGLAMHPLLASTQVDPTFSRVRASYLVSVPASEAGLDVLRNALRSRLKGAVEFFELPEAVQAPSADTPRDLLWWTQSPTHWTPRATVPTVIATP
jgi:hypothetical protein